MRVEGLSVVVCTYLERCFEQYVVLAPVRTNEGHASSMGDTAKLTLAHGIKNSMRVSSSWDTHDALRLYGDCFVKPSSLTAVLGGFLAGV